jgi:cobalt/nickel transport system permease protein
VLYLHIPDGFLDAKTAITTGLISLSALSYSAFRTQKTLNDKQLPTLGIMSAFIFAGQMINFPIGVGTSGHLLGAAMATILLGPFSASLIIGTVLIIQCFFFQDGGLMALGANIFNMAILGVAISYLSYTILTKLKIKRSIATFITAWLSVICTATMASIELAVSGTVPLVVSLPAMAVTHTLIGTGEGIITAVVVKFIQGYNKSTQSVSTQEANL